MLLMLTKIVLIMNSYENDIILIKTYPKKKKKKKEREGFSHYYDGLL
jgi:hypothetical protein